MLTKAYARSHYDIHLPQGTTGYISLSLRPKRVFKWGGGGGGGYKTAAQRTGNSRSVGLNPPSVLLCIRNGDSG